MNRKEFNEKPDCYIITLTDDNDPNLKTYLYRDPDCGFLMYGAFSYCHKFSSLESAQKTYDSMMDELNQKTIGPPDFIHRGLKMNFNKPKASGTLAIEKIATITIRSNKVSGEIKTTDVVEVLR